MQEVWDQLKLGSIDVAKAYEQLTGARWACLCFLAVYRCILECIPAVPNELLPLVISVMICRRDAGIQLSSRSRDLLGIEDVGASVHHYVIRYG